jgi:hypothetical protein
MDIDVLTGAAVQHQRRPSAARPFAFTAPALGVRDHLGGGQRRSLSPSSVEVAVSQSVTRGSGGVLDGGVVDLEAHRAHPYPDSVCGTTQTGSLTVITGEPGEAFEHVGNAQHRLNLAGNLERVVYIAFGLLGQLLCDGDAARVVSILKGIKGTFVAIGSIIAALVCAIVAAMKGRNPFGWAFWACSLVS